jgi:2-polyprenyl-3-methyl-5-hydroxy-6-metoxy-1,4-benzoquinol methylase
MVFADPASRPDRFAERAEYDRHRNDPSDPGYRTFLSRLAKPLLERLTPGMEGLDFGSGPGPTLSVMLEEAGMHVTLYDPQYAPQPTVLERRYDFVTATEVVEHFHDPARDWARLASLLKPGGVLGVMTKQPLDRDRFEQWHYKDDPTHVSFHRPRTFAWIAERFGLTHELIGPDVAIFRRNGPAAGQ